MNLKKALKHDVEVAGKAIPTMLIAALFLVGGGSAALLTSFGTVSGTADVDQPIQLDNQNQLSAEASYNDTKVIGGETVIADSYPVSNNLNQTVAVGFETEIKNGSDGDWHDQSEVTGVSTSHVVSSEWAVKSEEQSDVSVEPVQRQVTDGDYALHFSTQVDEATSDYAIAWFPTSEIAVENFDSVKYDGEVKETAPTDVAQNPLADEVWILTEDGEAYWYHKGSSDASFSLDSSNFQNHSGDYSGDFSDVVAVGVGQGAPREGGYYVDTYIDNVRLTGDETQSLDETGDLTLDILPTGESEGIQKDYSYQTVTSFDIDVLPQDYTIENRLVPQ